MQSPDAAHTVVGDARTSGEARKASTSALLPMPASPETNANGRSPARARANSPASLSRASVRPTPGRASAPIAMGSHQPLVDLDCQVAADPVLRAETLAGGCTVSMKRGVLARSPRTARSSPIDLFSVSSPTVTPGQSALNSSSFVASIPAAVFGRRHRDTAHSPVEDIARDPPRISRAARRSNLNGDGLIAISA